MFHLRSLINGDDISDEKGHSITIIGDQIHLRGAGTGGAIAPTIFASLV